MLRLATTRRLYDLLNCLRPAQAPGRPSFIKDSVPARWFNKGLAKCFGAAPSVIFSGWRATRIVGLTLALDVRSELSQHGGVAIEESAGPILRHLEQREVLEDGTVRPLSEHALERIERVGWNDFWGKVTNRLTDPTTLAREGPPTLPESAGFKVMRWGEGEGLPDNKVRSLTRTSDGLLWVGTARGVARFDGRLFRVAGTAGQYSARALHADRNDCVWVGTDQGLFRVLEGRLIQVPEAKDLVGVKIHDLAERKGEGLWIASDQGVGFLRAGQYVPLPIAGLSSATAVAEGDHELLWVGSRHGLFGVGCSTGTIHHHDLKTVTAANGSVFDDVVIRDLLPGADGSLWIGTTYGTWVRRAGAPALEQLSDLLVRGVAFPGNARLARDATGSIWATSEAISGLCRYTLKDGLIRATRLLEELEGTRSVLADLDGVVWVGSDHGLFKVFRLPVEVFSLKAQVPLTGHWHVLPDSGGGLLLATSMGRLTLAGHWARDALRLFTFSLTTDAFLGQMSLASSGRDGGRGRHGLPNLIFAPAFVDNGQSRPHTSTWRAVAVDQSGHSYVASTDSLFHMSPGGALNLVGGVPPCDIAAMHLDVEKTLWIATRDRGLCRLQHGQFAPISSVGGDVWPALSLADGADGRLWVGLDRGLGLCVGGVLRPVPLEPSVSLGPVAGVIKDRSGDVWLNHGRGLARLREMDLDRWQKGAEGNVPITEFGAAEGLSIWETSSEGSNVAMTPDGHLWFAKKGGLAVVQPELLPPAPNPPHIQLESLETDGHLLGSDSKIALSVTQSRRLRFHIAVLSPSYADRCVVQHRLEGFESRWQDSGHTRVASYAALGPGTYRLLARLRTPEGRWSDAVALQTLRIRAPFWRTLPAVGGGGLLVAGALVFVVRRQLSVHRWRTTQEGEAALHRERQRIARDLHDHLGARLAEQSLTQPEGAASDQTEEVLEELRELIWSVHPANDSLAGLAEFITSYSTRFLSAAGITTDIHIADRLPGMVLSGGFRHDVSAMFKEVMRNVVQHAGARRVTVEFDVAGDHLFLEVKDDGVGFDVSTMEHSEAGSRGDHGLHNLLDRVAAHGGRIDVTSGLGLGTVIQIRLPLPHGDQWRNEIGADSSLQSPSPQ